MDLDAVKSKWLGMCGSCDVGIGECNHPAEDYRPVMLELVREVERLQFDAEEAKRLRQMVDIFRPVLRASRRWRDNYAADITEANENLFHPAEADWIRAVDAVDGIGFIWDGEDRLVAILRPDGEVVPDATDA